MQNKCQKPPSWFSMDQKLQTLEVKPWDELSSGSVNGIIASREQFISGTKFNLLCKLPDCIFLFFLFIFVYCNFEDNEILINSGIGNWRIQHVVTALAQQIIIMIITNVYIERA